MLDSTFSFCIDARKRNNEGAIAGGILGPIALLGLVALVVLLGVWAYKKRKNRKGIKISDVSHIVITIFAHFMHCCLKKAQAKY